MLTIDDYRRWLHDCLTMGIPALSLDTSAQILAVIHSLGNNEQMTHSPQFLAEVDYIRTRFHIDGGETPDSEIVPLIKEYIGLIEESDHVPRWAEKIFRERYGIKLYR